MSVYLCEVCGERGYDGGWMCAGCQFSFHDHCEVPVHDENGEWYCKDCFAQGMEAERQYQDAKARGLAD